MPGNVSSFLASHREVILARWQEALEENFGSLPEDSRLWLDHELTELFDEIVSRLADPAGAARTESESAALSGEIFDSMEFASRIECLLTGMRIALRVVREIGGDDETVRELEASLRLQVHEEVEAFCRRRADKDLDGDSSTGQSVAS